MQYVFLSHDVDWRKQGPGSEHILARKERFDQQLFKKTPLEKMYYNFPEFMEIEEKFGTKSTFFFRTTYENGNVFDYEDEIKLLNNEKWEIGLHLDPSSVNDIEKISKEKNIIEEIAHCKILGNRVHFLKTDKQLQEKLNKLGFIYDSSVKKIKEDYKEDIGYYIQDKIIEFPITIMDAYLFTYMKIKEEKIISLFDDVLEYSRKINSEFNIISLLWHDNVLKMKGGRMYSKILEFLSSQEDVVLCNGIELVKKIKSK
jgi:peptidoglycan/xylan/chitin deacetylase (PgdA/CDA1 family)